MSGVCFYNIAAGLGGAERSLLEMIRGLAGSRYAPMLVTPVEGPLTERVRALNVPVVVEPLPGLLRLGRNANAADYLRATSGIFLAGYFRRFSALLREHGAEIVHANSVKTMFLTAPMRLFRPRPRIVWHIRDVMTRRRFFGLIDSLGARVPDAIVTNSDFTAAQFRRCRSRVVRIYNGLVLDEYRPATDGERAEFKRQWGIPERRKLVGILGVLTPWKGHRVFLEAAKQVLATRAEAHFLVIGDEIYDTAGHRGYRAELEAYARELGIADRVTFTGFLNPVERALGCLDVLVHASIEPEPFGRVVVEGQASGVPVVASRSGGVPEIVPDGSVGTLVRPGDPADMARAVGRYLDSDDLRRLTASAARKWALERFSLPRLVDELSSLYDRLLKEPAHRD